MEMKKDINEQIEQTLQSLDGMEQVSPTPFFFTRLEARMQNKRSVWEKTSAFISRPIIVFASISFVIILNAAVIFSSPANKNTNPKQSTELASVDEYSQMSTNFNEFENLNP
jgi:hypothetical protein